MADMAFDPRMTGADSSDQLARAARGEAGALAALYRTHGDTIYRFAWALTGSEALAADVLQDTFLGLMQQRLSFDPARGSVAAYLCGMARHLAWKRLGQRDQPSEDAEMLADQAADPAPAPWEAIAHSRRLELLYAAIRRLPPHYRDALVLVDLQEWSYAEAASVMGVDLGTVRSRLARARQRLSQLLGAPRAVEDARSCE